MYDNQDVDMIVEFKRLNDQSAGRLETALVNLGWKFDTNTESADFASNGTNDANSLSFTRDVYKTARDIGLQL